LVENINWQEGLRHQAALLLYDSANWSPQVLTKLLYIVYSYMDIWKNVLMCLISLV